MCRKTEVWTQCPEHLCSYRVSGSSHLTRVKEGCRVESKGPTLGGHCERPSDRWRVWLMLRGSIRSVRFETGSNKQGVPPSPEGAKTAEPKLHHCGCAYTDTQGQRPGGLQTEVRGCPAVRRTYKPETTDWSWTYKPFFQTVTKLNQTLSTSSSYDSDPKMVQFYREPSTFVVYLFIMTIFWQVSRTGFEERAAKG